MMSYEKLWKLLEKKEMKKTDLLEIISSATLAKMGKNQAISGTNLEKICEFLECQPGDIMEYISQKMLDEIKEQSNELMKTIMAQVKEAGYTEEQFLQMIEHTGKEMFINGKEPDEAMDNAVEKYGKKKDTEQ